MMPKDGQGKSTQRLLHGVAEVRQALLRDSRVHRVWIGTSLGRLDRQEILSLCRSRGIRPKLVPDVKLASMCGCADHGAVACQQGDVALGSFDDLLAAEPDARRVLFALDGVVNPRNLGLAARSLLAAGCRHILLPATGSALPAEALLEGSSGYASDIAFVRVPNLARALRDLKDSGYWVYGLEAGARASLFGYSFPDQVVFVLGNETKGMHPIVRKAVDEFLSIPMDEGVESLNVAVTAALCAFEIRRGQGRLATAR